MICKENTDEILQDLAQFFIHTAANAIAENGRFSVALSGGNSPKKLFQIIAQQYHTAIDWSKVAFFYSDERTVAPQHPDYNGLMARENLLAPLGIAEANIYEVNTLLSPQMAAAAYWQKIQDYFGSEKPQFDLVLLGLGDDAHTASLFPGTEAIKETEAKVIANYVPKLNTWRITFTYALINNAKNIAFLTFGAGKADAVAQIFKAERNANLYPAQLIQGNVHWYIDAAAGAKLS